MTSSKSDLEAKEGQIPNESNFLEFVSLLGSLSTRAGGSITQEDQGLPHAEEAEAAEAGESQFTCFSSEEIHFGAGSSAEISTECSAAKDNCFGTALSRGNA